MHALRVQALRAAVRERPTPDLEALLLAFAKPFQRLVMDNARYAERCLAEDHVALALKGWHVGQVRAC